MKRILIIAALIALVAPSAAFAQATATGSLQVTATVQSSITLVFASNATGVPLANSGTSNATLAFGNVSAYAPIAANITRTYGAGNFAVSTPVDVLVTSYNSGSPAYTLRAQLASNDATNGWSFGGTNINSAAATTITAAGTYGVAGTHPVMLTIPLTAAAGAITNTINVTATAN